MRSCDSALMRPPFFFPFCAPLQTADGCVYLCDLLLWDSGFTSAAQYKYIQTTPESHAQLVLYVVSCVDRNSWMLVQRKVRHRAGPCRARPRAGLHAMQPTRQQKSLRLRCLLTA